MKTAPHLYTDVCHVEAISGSFLPSYATSSNMNTKSKIEKRLSSYWKMEIANIVLVPTAIIYFTFRADSPVGWLSLFAMLPMCGLLLVGGLYWRGKHMQLKRNPRGLDSALAFAHRLQYPLLILTLLACLLSASAWINVGLARGMGDKFAATFAAVMAVLEYINYYHRQIQHFDHMSDFKRLIKGRGFRPAQMNQDLKSWRNKRRLIKPS